ncbi:MAG: hypothetical protein UU22_C0037G0002 [Parcubacteria group bacterium GW2011_GWA2_40_8]|nr:MAG: hypothetical protein UU22_C0037G0002 [Parcubacteria group bacterium GW2011_GWA2_40_8]
MLDSYNTNNEPFVANLSEERVSEALMWQCTKCGYSESVQGRMQNGTIHIDENNDFYIVNWRIFRNEVFVKEVHVIYHVPHAALNAAVKNFEGRLGNIPQSQLGCCGKIELFAWGQYVDPATLRYKINEIRIHQAR